MFRQSSIMGSTFFASREPVRNPLTLKMMDRARRMASRDLSLTGSLGVRLPRGLLLTIDTPLAKLAEGDIVEVTDYDPVRKTSMVIGLKEPSVHVPLHWLGLRTHPEDNVTLLLHMEEPPKGVPLFSSKLLHASFEEAMEVVRAMKAGNQRAMFLEGRGVFLVSKDLETLLDDVKALLGTNSPKKKGTRSRKKAKKVERKARSKDARSRAKRPASKRQVKGKRKSHYKRGPTRRSSPRRG
jgi:hypothetical protein